MAEIRLADLTWQEADALRRREDVLGLIPLAAIEQHGPHMPLSTDLDIAGWLASAIAGTLERPVLVAPILPAGFSPQHTGFPGSVTLAEGVLEGYVDALLSAFASVRVRQVAVFSSHGGNFPFVADVARRLASRHPGMAVAGYGDLNRFFDVLFSAARAAGLEPPRTDIHAGAIETSMMLALFPEKCRLDRAGRDEYAEEHPPGDWIDRMRLEGVRTLSASGVLGSACRADAAAGQAILEAWVADLAAWIGEIFS